jgi:two-component system chemotaxis response regulator CheB
MRKAIQKALALYQDIEVAGTAKNGQEALAIIPQINPDVITLDVNMPVMDGITTLKHIAVQFPKPVIMLSAFTQEGAETTFDCLTLGAMDFICKPSQAEGQIEDQVEALVSKIRLCAKLRLKAASRMRVQKTNMQESQDITARPHAGKIVVMVGGEGSDGAYLRIIPYLLKSIPCSIVACQQMDAKIFPSFCQYLDKYSRIVVKQIQHNDLLKKGVCYFLNAPISCSLQKTMLGTACHLGPCPGNFQQSLDAMLQAAATIFSAQTVGVLLTGKEYPREGLRTIKRAGGMVLAQNPTTCLNPDNIYGALDSGCIDKLIAEDDMPAMLWHLLRETK